MYEANEGNAADRPLLLSLSFSRRSVNEVSQTPLVYDFYGFPPKFYEQKFNSVSQPWLVELTKAKLKEGGVGVTGVGGKGRGLDHGAWSESVFQDS